MGGPRAFLRLPAPVLPRRTRGRCLWVTLEKAGKPLARVSSTRGLVRWGPSPSLELPYPVPGVDRKEELFRPLGSGARLMLREGMDGELWAGSSRLALRDAEELGLARGWPGHRWIRIQGEMAGRIEYRGLVLRFEFGPEPVVEARIRPAPVPKGFRRPLLAKEDRPFAALVWAIYGVLFLLAAALATRPLPKEVHPDALARRFARLIYEAPQAKTRVRQEILRKREAEVAAAKPETKAEAPKSEPEKPKTDKARPPAEPDRTKPEHQPPETPSTPDATAANEAPAGEPAPAGPPSPSARAEQIRESVRGKGLLGILGGRGAATVARTGGSLLQGNAPSDLDRVLDQVEGLRKTSEGGGGGSGGRGVLAGRPVSRGIDEAAREVVTASPKAPQLQERQEQRVEARESNEPQDSFSLKEATAAINRAVAAYTGGLRYLYNKELRKNPDLEGKLTVSITIAPNGAVAECHMVDSTLRAPDLEKAILDRIRKWTFPPVAAKPITVTYPFVFFPTM